MSEWISIVILWAVIFGGIASWFYISNRRDPPPIPPEPKEVQWARNNQQVCRWLAPCPKCGRSEAVVYLHGNMLYQGEDVECAHCGNKGTIEVYGPEEVDVDWDGDK